MLQQIRPGVRLILAVDPERKYWKKVMRLGPLAYWPLWERTGTVAQCLTNPAMNGTYNSDVSGWPPGDGIGDGHAAPWFDGAADYVNIYSAALAAALSGAQGTMAIWCKVNSAATWTDATTRFAAFLVDSTPWVDYIQIAKLNSANMFRYLYSAAGVASSVADYSGPVQWFHAAITWDKPADQMKGYLNGVQVGTTQTGLGAWTGTIDNAYIGASWLTPTDVWHGWLAHCAVFPRALPVSEIVSLANG